MKAQVSIIILCLSFKSVFSCCAGDDRTLTELLFLGSPGSIFTCTILKSEKNEKTGDLYSWVKVNKIYFGRVDSNIVKIRSGNMFSSVSGVSLPNEQQYLIYATESGNIFSCCVCDSRSKMIKNNSTINSELNILHQFSEIFVQKKSGQFEFFKANGNRAATGLFLHGKATGEWKHYSDSNIIKSKYDLDHNITINYSKNGFKDSKVTISNEEAIREKYSNKVNDRIKFKSIEIKNDSGMTIQFYDYFENGNLKQVYSQIYINVQGGSTSGGKTGKYEEYYKNGTSKLSGEYSKNRRIGVWTWYFENGEYNTRFDYKNGEEPQ